MLPYLLVVENRMIHWRILWKMTSLSRLSPRWTFHREHFTIYKVPSLKVVQECANVEVKYGARVKSYVIPDLQNSQQV